MLVTAVKKKTIFQKGITQKALAQKLGYSPEQIKHVLNLDRFTPHIQESIARHFGKSVEELFGRWAWTRQVIRRGRRLRTQGLKSLKVQKFKGRDTPPAPLNKGEKG